jgi:hypothetical protein
MINYTDTQNIDKLCKLEKESLKATLEIQNLLNKQILTFLKNFMSNYEIKPNNNLENASSKYLSEAIQALTKSNDNINSIKELSTILNNITSPLSTQIEQYNEKFSLFMEKIYSNTSQIEDFLHNISMNDLSKILEDQNITQEQINEEESSFMTSQELDSSFVENTLIISSIQNKVILPYTINNIYQTLLAQTNESSSNDLSQSKITSINDVIEKVYTKPLYNYRFSALARFREGYRLMVDKEKKSKFEAIMYAIELFTNYNLHPAIITACQNQEQLDIYLSCLEDNKLNEFNFFNIKFEIPPSNNVVKC